MKKILGTLILLIIFSFSLVSCGDTGSDGDEPLQSGNIYSKESDVTLVYDAGKVDTQNAELVYDKLTELTGRNPKLGGSSSASAAHEIVIGETSREISKKAYKLLDRIEKDDYDYVRFLIYSDGKSVALAFDGEMLEINAAEEDAINYFIENYCVSDSLSMKKGIAYQTAYSVIERQQKLEEPLLAEYWAEAEKALTELYGEAMSAEITASLKELYTIYSDDTVSWLANLYDPVTGGFYYSNSARNTEGFLPNLESTYQALQIISSSGMLANYDSDVAKGLPSWMGEQIVAFTKSLQDPDNGYFYHPQWSRILVDSLPARQGRDLTNAVNILSKYGAKPTYDTPSGVEGDGILYDGTPVSYSALTGQLGSSRVAAVSKVVLLNSTSDVNVASHLKTKEAFEAYLAGLDINGNCYSVGNLLESQANQIVARDKVLSERGETYRLCDILANWFDEHQNPRTGTWLLNDEINYEAVNGILKISSTYDRINKEMPNAVLCIKASIVCLTDTTPIELVCDALNPWYAITVIRNNMTKHTGNDVKYNQILSDMLPQFAEAVRTTRQKLTTLLRTDGSFGGLPESSEYSAQGVPAAVPGTLEGDVNGTYLSTCGTVGHIFNSLMISDKQVPIYTEADRLRLVSIIENLGAIVKDAPVDDRDTASGDYTKKYGGVYYPEGTSTYNLDTVYRYTTEVRHGMSEITKQTHEYMQIVSDDDKSSGVLEYGKASLESYYGLCFDLTGNQQIGNCFVFETEIKINSITDKALASITSGGLPVLVDFQLAKTTSITAAHVSTNVFYDKIGGIYLTKDGSSYKSSFSHAMSNWQYLAKGSLGQRVDAEDWYTVAFELYDNGMAKYYVNNKYIGEARVLEDPSVFSEIDTVRVALNSKATECNIWLDNTFVGNVSKEYKEGNKLVNYDGYLFRAGEHYDNFGGLDYETALVKSLENSGYLVRSTWYTKDNMEGKTWEEMTNEYIRIAEESVETHVNRVLEFTTLKNNAKGIYIRESSGTVGGDCFAFETDIKLTVDSETVEKMLSEKQHYLASIYAANAAAASSVTGKDPNTSYAEIARIYAKKDSGGTVRYYINYPYASTNKVAVSETEITEGWHTFTAEMYAENGYIKYYLDGNYIGEYRLAASAVSESFDSFNAVKLSFKDIIDNSTIWLDNTFVGRVNKAYVSDEAEDDTPAQPDSSSGGALGAEEGDDSHDADAWT